MPVDRQSFTRRLAEHFTRHAGEWLDARDLEYIAGRQAWRTRVSECRVQLGMVIENRQRHQARPDGTSFTVSEYRYAPACPVSAVDGSQPTIKW